MAKAAATGSAGTRKGVKDWPVYLFFGSDEYLVDSRARRIVDELCPPASQTFGLEVVNGRCDKEGPAVQAVRQCLQAVQTAGFFGSGKVVWFRDVTFFADASLLKKEDLAPWIGELMDLLKTGLPAGHRLVVSADSVDRRTALFKALSANALVEEFNIPEKSYQADAQAREKIQRELSGRGLSIGQEALADFVSRTGADTRAILQEVEKLALYLGDRKQIAAEDVRDIVSSSRESASWDLADAVGSRNLPASLHLLQQLLFQKNEPIALIAGLESRFRDLAVFRECLDRRWLNLQGNGVAWTPAPEAEARLAELGSGDPRSMHPFRAGRLAAQAANFGARQIGRIRDDIMRTREEMVSGFPGMELLLEFLVIRIVGGGRPRPAARA